MLARRSVLVHGRLFGLTRERVAVLVRRAGGRVARELRPSTGLLVIAHSTVDQLRSGLLPALLAQPLAQGPELMGEIAFRRLLGLAPPSEPEPRELDRSRLAQIARIAPDTLEWLRLFDVIEPAGGRFSFRDMVAAREVGRLLADGFPLADIIAAAIRLRRETGQRLSDARLEAGPLGLARRYGGRPLDPSGQFQLPIAVGGLTAEGAFQAAEDCQREGERAVRLFDLACKLDRDDPVLPFALGQALHSLGRREAAAVAFRQALARDPGFAEAHFHLALDREDRGHGEEAVIHYQHAIQARPDYADAVFNLALLLYRLGRYGQAVPHWERYLSLDPRGRWAERARRYAVLCRMSGG